jgi:UDP-glucose 4-epimerase
MKILITGGSGFIGSTLALSLANNGHEVVVLDRRSNPMLSCNSTIAFRQGDFSNPVLLETVLEGVEVVYHLAWSTIPATSNVGPEADISVNLIGTLCLLSACAKKGVRRVIFSSTGGTVYGDTQINLITEAAPTYPLCSYGITKLAAEKYLGVFYHLKGLEYVVLRISNAYGPNQDPKSGVGFIGAALASARDNRKLTLWGDGSVVRDYIFVDDIVNAMTMSAVPTFPVGIYHVSSGVGFSLNELLSLISGVIGRDIRTEPAAGRNFDVKRVILDNNKLRAIGWDAKVSIKDGICRIWAAINGVI